MGGAAGLIHNRVGADVLVIVFVLAGEGEVGGATVGSGTAEHAPRRDTRMIAMMILFMISNSKLILESKPREQAPWLQNRDLR